MHKMLLFFFVFILGGIANAQWNNDPTVNNLLVGTADKGTTVISEFVTVSDGNNGAYIAWVDTRTTLLTGSDIFLIRILPDGSVAPGFAPGGNAVCAAAGNQDQLSMVSDGAGGVIIAWRDARNSGSPVNNDIFAQRVNASGTALWTADGVAIVSTSVNEQNPVLALTNPATVGIVWRGTVDGLDLFANFINVNDGSKVLGTDLTIISKANTQSNQSIVADGAGGFVVCWVDGRVANNNSSIHAQRVNSSGTFLWGAAGSEADGLEVSFVSGSNHLAPAMVSDGTEGGVVIVYGSTRVAPTNTNLYAQRVLGNGTPAWTTNGEPVTLADGNQSDPIITKSGSRVIVAWRDARLGATNTNVFTQSLTIEDGSANWTTDGLQLNFSTGNQPASTGTNGFTIIEDNNGGATVIWDDAQFSTSNVDIHAHKITNDGNLTWPTNGARIAALAGSNQNWPSVVPVANGNLMVIWRDGRNATNAELFASILETSGVLPTHFLSVQASQKGKHVEVNWTTSGEQNLRQYVVERSSNGVQFEAAGVVTPQNTQGRHNYSWLDQQPHTGNNFYRIKSVDLDGSSQLSNVVKAILPEITTRGLNIYPNPALSNVQMQLGAQVKNGEYSVRIIDASGKVLQQSRLQKSQANQQVSLGVSSLKAGLYRIQLIDASGKTVVTEAILKQ